MRYSRQTILPQIGEIGQQRLQQARVLLVGVGGLGCPALQYLIAAGVGNIQLMDADTVDLSNLQRQILFTENDVGKFKVEVAQQRMQALNAACQISISAELFNADNAVKQIEGVDVVLDCTDDLYTKYLLNDYCYWENKPLISASLLKFAAQLAFYHPPITPCMRCVFPASSQMDVPSCEEAGILGAVAGAMGGLQALEVIKYIVGHHSVLADNLLTFDFLTYQIQPYRIEKDNACALCSGQKNSVLIYPNRQCAFDFMTWEEFQQRDDVQLLDVRTPEEHQAKNLGGINIPLADLSNHLSQLDKQKIYLIHCRSGQRSQKAADFLRKNQFKKVYLLRGCSLWSVCTK